MRSILLIILAAMIPAVVTAERSDEAQKAGEDWLSLLDSQNYSESWNQASAMFRNQVKEEDWIASLKRFRDPLGAMASRNPHPRLDFTKTLRGAPDGDYAIFHFKTAFKNKADVTERLTMVLEDGRWRASAYAIH